MDTDKKFKLLEEIANHEVENKMDDMMRMCKGKLKIELD